MKRTSKAYTPPSPQRTTIAGSMDPAGAPDEGVNHFCSSWTNVATVEDPEWRQLM
jgi:hypothetical protein